MNQDLKEKFLVIKNKGWIESMRYGTSGIGYTFESLIGKKEDNFFVPDYDDIEIKTVKIFSKQKVHLLNLTPDGDYLFPIKEIIKKLGYPDKDYPNYNVFNMSFTAIEYTKINKNTYGKIRVNRKDKKVELMIKKGIIDKPIGISWSFDYIIERIRIKIKKLALIEAYHKLIYGKEYYKYQYLKYYELKEEEFIKAIENGKIEITFKIGIFKKGERFGQIHDRGTDFSIYIKNIESIYNLKEII